MSSRGLRLLALALSMAAPLACRASAPRDVVASTDRCDDLSSDDLGTLYSGSIDRVERIDAKDDPRGGNPRLAGASIYLRHSRIDDALFERALACHASRADVPVRSIAAPQIDPLRPPGGEVRVAIERRDDDVVVVRLTSRVETVAAEVLHRAEVLKARARERARRVASDP